MKICIITHNALVKALGDVYSELLIRQLGKQANLALVKFVLCLSDYDNRIGIFLWKQSDETTHLCKTTERPKIKLLDSSLIS